jgi:hypothetical protein
MSDTPRPVSAIVDVTIHTEIARCDHLFTGENEHAAIQYAWQKLGFEERMKAREEVFAERAKYGLGRCAKAAPTPGYEPCRRNAHADGPCAHERTG